MKKAIIVLLVCSCGLMFSALAIAGDGSSVSTTREDYVVTGIASGGDKQLNTIIIFDTKKQYVWWLDIYSGRLTTTPPVWRFKDLSGMEPKTRGGHSFED